MHTLTIVIKAPSQEACINALAGSSQSIHTVFYSEGMISGTRIQEQDQTRMSFRFNEES